MNQRVARAMRAANRHYADGGDVQDNRNMFSRAADTAMDYAGRGLALGDLYTGGVLSSLAGLNPFTSYGSVMEARDRALAGVPRDAKALATENINPMMAMAAAPAAMGRTVDKLGFYSKLDEVLAGFKPKDSLTAQTLQQRGVKSAELEARGVLPLLTNGRSAPASEIASVASKNPVQLKEGTYSSNVRLFDDGSHMIESGAPDGAKWQNFSLDPMNPSYRETVLYLPTQDDIISNKIADLANSVERGELSYTEFAKADKVLRAQLDNLQETPFKSGHFVEPNIVGHTMTSTTKHDGRPVYTLDQIQSDWGQKLRERGVRDEAKILDLKRQINEEEQKLKSLLQDPKYRGKYWDTLPEGQQLKLLQAELRTAEAATVGNPLVNNTDQWVNTTLRRALRAAADQNAEFIAVPYGDTVLSYNPGQVKGMREFYGSSASEGIVPKNLRKLLTGVDQKAGKPLRVPQLETPSRGRVGAMYPSKTIGADDHGFTLFGLSPEARQEIKKGLPIFGAAGLGLLAGYSEEPKE